MPVLLVACGFNANWQLLPSTGTPGRLPHNIPDDIMEPLVIASGEKMASVLFAGWSNTLLEIDDKLYIRGADAHGKQVALSLPTNEAPAKFLIQSFGDHSGAKGILTFKGDLLLLSGLSQSGDVKLNPVPLIKDVAKITIAGNGKVCVIKDKNKVVLWRTFDAFTSQEEPEEEFDLSGITSEIIELESNESAFTFLTANGEVFTFGDSRHNNIGRSLDTPGQSASKPGIVDALDGVPIAHISSGGWITAALSRQEDLYIWGGRAGGDELIKGLEDLDGGYVSLVDLGGGLDVKDVAVGAGHIVALTVDGRVWVAGRGENGQIGVSSIGFQREWKEIQGLPEEKKANKVSAGGWGTFVRLGEADE